MTNHTAEDFEQARFAERPDVLRHDAIWDAYSETWRLGSGKTIDVQRLAAGGWVPVREATPVSLDTLRTAWENAEQPTEDAPTREGDVVIVRNDSGIGGYFVRPSHETHDFEIEAEGSVRILSRAPQREAWADLADALRAEGTFLDDEDLEKYFPEAPRTRRACDGR